MDKVYFLACQLLFKAQTNARKSTFFLQRDNIRFLSQLSGRGWNINAPLRVILDQINLYLKQLEDLWRDFSWQFKWIELSISWTEQVNWSLMRKYERHLNHSAQISRVIVWNSAPCWCQRLYPCQHYCKFKCRHLGNASSAFPGCD